MLKIIWHARVDSTNSLSLRQIQALDNLSVVAAREQTAGRGQRGNRWISSPGENLTFSLVLRFGGDSGLPELPVADIWRLSMVAAVSVRDYLRGEGCEALIKWPNDLLAGGKKICGILIENGLSGSGVAHSVIGIGINLNQRRFDDLANATSLSCVTGRPFDIEAGLEKVCACLEGWLPALHDGEKYADLCREYDAALFRRGVSCPYRDLLIDKEFRGVIECVDKGGKAVVRDCDDGSVRKYAFKELGYIL